MTLVNSVAILGERTGVGGQHLAPISEHRVVGLSVGILRFAEHERHVRPTRLRPATPRQRGQVVAEALVGADHRGCRVWSTDIVRECCGFLANTCP